MHTEDEAKTKLCVHQRPATLEFGVNWCSASQCMAWRWYGWRNDRGYLFLTTATEPEDSADVRIGYCGLAGKP